MCCFPNCSLTFIQNTYGHLTKTTTMTISQSIREHCWPPPVLLRLARHYFVMAYPTSSPVPPRPSTRACTSHGGLLDDAHGGCGPTGHSRFEELVVDPQDEVFDGAIARGATLNQLNTVKQPEIVKLRYRRYLPLQDFADSRRDEF